MIRRYAAIFMATVALAATVTIGGAQSVSAVTKTNVVVQGGTTPVDSGLYQNVIFPLFTKQFPQYNLQYVSVGTAQALTNAENGQGDVVFTHSPAAESTFVSQGYSYEAGGRLVMASDFVTVGAKSDPAGVVAAGNHNAIAGFKAIAAAGAAGHADFVSRGDGSGTNKNEQAMWKLTGIPVNSAGEPVNPSNAGQLASWYHKSGLGQAENLQIANECPFDSGDCYTLTDSGTFRYLSGNGSVPNLELVSQFNDAPGSLGGVGLLLNPYHVYAVNPAKLPSANINLPGALAFLNFMTSASTQIAIGKYPNTSKPAFVPDARPKVVMFTNVPLKVKANKRVTVVGTVKPSYYLDPAINNVPVFLERQHAPGVVLASTTLPSSNSSFTMTFTPTVTDTYTIVVPAFPDSMILPTNTAYRQSTTAVLRKMTVTGTVTIDTAPKSGLVVNVHGTAAPLTNRKAARVQIQYKSGTTWVNAAKAIVMKNGAEGYSQNVKLPKAGTWSLRARYTDPNVVAGGYSPVTSVSVP